MYSQVRVRVWFYIPLFELRNQSTSTQVICHRRYVSQLSLFREAFMHYWKTKIKISKCRQFVNPVQVFLPFCLPTSWQYKFVTRNTSTLNASSSWSAPHFGRFTLWQLLVTSGHEECYSGVGPNTDAKRKSLHLAQMQPESVQWHRQAINYTFIPRASSTELCLLKHRSTFAVTSHQPLRRDAILNQFCSSSCSHCATEFFVNPATSLSLKNVTEIEFIWTLLMGVDKRN